MTGSGAGDPPDEHAPADDVPAPDEAHALPPADAAAGAGEDTRGEDAQGENVVRVDFRRGARVADTAGPAADEKLRIFRELAAAGMVMVTLDARRPGVNVPSRFAKDAQLNLNFSHRFGVADFVYDAQGVRATLTFGGHPFYCDVPWGAVWGLRSHVDSPDQVTVFHDALPEELLAMLPQSAREQLARAQERRAADRASERERALERGDKDKPEDRPLLRPAPRTGPGVEAASSERAERPRGALRLVRDTPNPTSGDASDEDEPETIPDRSED